MWYENSNFTRFLIHSFVFLSEVLFMNLDFFTGRSTELGVLIDTFEDCCHKKDGRIVLLSGAVSSGKTCMTEKFFDKLKKNSFDFIVYKSELFFFDTLNDYNAFNILKDNISLENNETVDDFLRQQAIKQPVIFLVDNINYLDKKSADLLLYLFKSVLLAPYNIFFLLTLSDGSFWEIDNSYRFVSANFITNEIFLMAEKKENFLVQISLPPFRLADIAMYVSKRFKKSEFSSGFVNSLKEACLSNPFILKEILDYLILTEFLYVSKEGIWQQKTNELPLEKKSFNDVECKIISALKENQSIDSQNVETVLEELKNHYCYHSLYLEETEKLLKECLEYFVLKFPSGKVPKILEEFNVFFNKKQLFEKKSGHLSKDIIEQEIQKIISEGSLTMVFDRLNEFVKTFRFEYVALLAKKALENFSNFPLDSESEIGENKFELLRFENSALNYLGKFSKAKEISSQMLETAQKYELVSKIHFSYYTLGVDYLALADYECAKENLLKAIDNASKDGDSISLSIYNSQLGIVLLSAQNIKESQKFFYESERLCQKVENQEVTSKNKINIGIYYIFSGNFEMAEYYLKPLINFFEKNSDKRSLAKTFSSLSSLYQKTEDYELSESFALKAIKVDSEIGDNVALSSHFNNYGLLKLECRRYEEALEYFSKSLKISEFLSDDYKTAVCCSNIGDIYSATGDYVKAVNYFNKASECFLKVKNYQGVSVIYTSTAEVYKNIEDFDNALKYFSRAMTVSQEHNLFKDFVYICNVSGDVYVEKKDLQSALSCYDKALKCAKENNFEDGLITTLYNIGNAYLAYNDFVGACSRYHNGKYLAEKKDDETALCVGYTCFGKYYLKRNELSKAIENYGFAIEYANKVKNGFLLGEALIGQADVYSVNGDLKDACENYEKAQEIYSLIGDNVSRINTICKNAVLLSENAKYSKAVSKLKEALNICTELGDNTLFVLVYIAFGDVEFEEEHYKKSLGYFEKAYNILDKNEVKRKLYFECTDKMAEVYIKLEQPEDAILIHLGQLELLKNNKEKESLVKKYLDIASDYKEQNMIERAEETYKLALNLSESVYDRYVKSDALFEMGEFYVNIDKYEKGISIMMKAPEVFGKDKMRDYRSANYYNIIADYQYDNNDFESALNTYILAGKIYQDLGDIYKTAYIYNNVGYCYDTLANFTEAAKYYELSYLKYREINDVDGIINNVKNCALMYSRTQNYNLALKYNLLALDYLEDLDAFDERGEVCLETAENYVKAYADYDESKQYVWKALEFFKHSRNVLRQIACLESFVMLEIVSGNEEFAKINTVRIIREAVYSTDKKIKIAAYKAAGNVYFRMSEFETCMQMFFNAFNESADSDDWDLIASVYVDWASVISSDDSELLTKVTFQSKEKTLAEFAIEFYTNALKIAKSGKKLSKTIADCYYSMASLKITLNQKEEALDLIEKAIKASNDCPPYKNVNMLISIGEMALHKLYNRDIALHCFHKALDEATKHNYEEMKIVAKGNISLVFFMTGFNEEAKLMLADVKDSYNFLLSQVPALTKYL